MNRLDVEPPGLIRCTFNSVRVAVKAGSFAPPRVPPAPQGSTCGEADERSAVCHLGIVVAGLSNWRAAGQDAPDGHRRVVVADLRDGVRDERHEACVRRGAARMFAVLRADQVASRAARTDGRQFLSPKGTAAGGAGAGGAGAGGAGAGALARRRARPSQTPAVRLTSASNGAARRSPALGTLDPPRTRTRTRTPYATRTPARPRVVRCVCGRRPRGHPAQGLRGLPNWLAHPQAMPRLCEAKTPLRLSVDSELPSANEMTRMATSEM